MKQILLFLVWIIILSSCKGQIEQEVRGPIGGPCEDCKAALDYKDLEVTPKSILQIEGYDQIEPKIKISGTVYEVDGKTPADGIVLYIYHTDRDGLYKGSENAVGGEARHGKYRGWIKTSSDGSYALQSFRPAAYPGGREVEHIHIYIKEPNKNTYYIDNFVFEDDPLLTSEKRNSLQNRGGSGIVQFEYRNGVYLATRDIILGKNIQDYY